MGKQGSSIDTKHSEIRYLKATEQNIQMLLKQLVLRCRSKEADMYNFVFRFSRDRNFVTIIKIKRRLDRGTKKLKGYKS